MKKIVYFLLSLMTCACFMLGASACDQGLSVLPDNDATGGQGDGTGGDNNSDDKGEETPKIALNKPVITLNGNLASWKAIENAVGYVYKIGEDGAEQITMDLVLVLTHGQTLYVKAMGDNVSYQDSDWSAAVTYEAIKLATPTMSLNKNLAKWSGLVGAISYVYKINDGEEQRATNVFVALRDGDTISVKAIGDGTLYLDSDWSEKQTFHAEYLSAPIITLDGNVARWTKVENAVGYVYEIDGEERETSELSVALVDGQSIKVKALGDNVVYKDGGWSNEETFYLTQLSAPIITLDGNVVSWEEVENAVGYVYEIDGEERETSELSVALVDGQSIRVKALGDNVVYKDGGWSNEETFYLTKLATPMLTLDGNVVSWEEVENAVGYVYEIDGEEREASELSVALVDGQSIRVKAIGDNVVYKDGGWSGEIIFAADVLSAPIVTLDGNVARWTEVENAIGYVYEIDGEERETRELSVALTDGQSIRVKAIGDNVVYKDGGWSNEETFYLTKLATPTLTLDGNVARWEEVENAIGYVYEIDGEERETRELSVALVDGQSVKVKAIGDNVVYKDGGWSNEVTYIALTLDKPQVRLVKNVVRWVVDERATKYEYKIGINGVIQTIEGDSIELAHGETAYIRAVGDGLLFKTSAWSMGLTYSATKLAMPKVTWEGNVAVWTEHSFATGYVYKIGENGEEIVATGNGVALTNGQTLYVKAVGDGVFYLDSEWRTVTYTAQKLVPPKPKTVEGVCSWTAVTGAVAYEYQIDGGQVQQTENTSVALSAYCTLKIRAIGDGEIYTSSDWYTYVYDAPTKLEVVGVHLNVATGVVAWDGKSVEGVEKYVYKIGADGAETDGGISGKVTLIEGEVVYIKAIGDGAEYLDSDWYALQYSKSGNGFEGYV